MLLFLTWIWSMSLISVAGCERKAARVLKAPVAPDRSETSMLGIEGTWKGPVRLTQIAKIRDQIVFLPNGQVKWLVVVVDYDGQDVDRKEYEGTYVVSQARLQLQGVAGGDMNLQYRFEGAQLVLRDDEESDEVAYARVDRE
jgi:hypothetical protein